MVGARGRRRRGCPAHRRAARSRPRSRAGSGGPRRCPPGSTPGACACAPSGPRRGTSRTATRRSALRRDSAGTAETLTIWPSIVWRIDRISPRPLHCGHCVGRRARLRSGAAAGVAPAEDRELDLLLGPVDRLVERDPEVVAQVRARLGPGGATLAAAHRPAEEGVEDVGEAAEAGSVEAFGAARARDAGLAEHVVRLAPLGIGEDLVGLVDLLEPLLGGRILVDVRVPLLGELAEGALDRGVVGSPLDAEHLVVVALTDHGRLRVYGTRASRPVRRPCARAAGRP